MNWLRTSISISIIYRGQAKAGDTVLIHGASGGVSNKIETLKWVDKDVNKADKMRLYVKGPCYNPLLLHITIS